MNVDYIIVGLGLAGVSFVEELKKHNRTFIAFEDCSQNSSLVAGGMYNPVILKRFTPVWNANEQLKIALPLYNELEKKFGKIYHHKVDIYRVFKSVEEQNNWFIACDNILTKNYMCPKIVRNKNKYIHAPFDFGKLTHTGRIDTKKLIQNYRRYLINSNLLRQERFQHENISFQKPDVKYNNINAKKVVFCEGFGVKENLFFNYLPMQEAKGELITIYAPELKVDFLIKAALFVLPMGSGLYKVGATFNWKDKTKTPTIHGKKELLDKLNTFLTCSYKIVEHTAGIRPTIIDRRPLVGIHPNHKQLAILNGLGTRGVMIAPLMTKKLYHLIEDNIKLEKEISIERFD